MSEISTLKVACYCDVDSNFLIFISSMSDELNDDALSDGGDEELTAEQQGLHVSILPELYQTEYT